MSVPLSLNDAVIFITGANRGLGRAFVTAALAAGARRVYAGARNPAAVDTDGDPRIVPVALDVTDAASVAAAAKADGDVTVLVNNAGVSRPMDPLQAGDVFAPAREELEANYFGPWAMTRAFAPVLAANGGGAVLNVLSVLAWVTFPAVGGYCASKSAAWSLSNGLRQALRGQGTRVASLHVGYMDTDMTRGLDAAKASPNEVASLALAGLAAGQDEILADAISQDVKRALSNAKAHYLT